MDNIPYIHLLKCSLGYYLYDVNTNKIIMIPQEVYEYLMYSENKLNDKVNQYLIDLKKKGYLKNVHVEQSEHFVTEYYKSFLEHNLSHVTLQVTQKCNLNCGYCVYSGKYNNRVHSDKWMSWEVACQAIDYLINNSQDSERVAISFYGGEPLLAYNFIKKCVDYAEKQAEGRKVSFNFTTNGTLLTSEKLDFLVSHNFKIMISLDGPRKIHNKNRKFKMGEGSFDIIIKNLTFLKEKYPKYYKHNISFNTVLDPQNSFRVLDSFIHENNIFEDMTFMSGIIEDNYSKNPQTYNEIFVQEIEYEIFKLFLWKLGRLQLEDVSPLILNQVSLLKRYAQMLEGYKQEKIEKKNHRGGPCYPGIRKLFVTVDGSLYPCERVSETSMAAYLGHISSGIELDKAIKVLNIEQKTPEKCRKCWAYYYCGNCIAKMDDGVDVSIKELDKNCKITKKQIEREFINYIILKELGYNREFDM